MSLLIVNFFINNMSRKKVLIISLGLAFAGSLALVLSSSMAMAVISLFVVGIGLEIPFRCFVSIITETTSKKLA